MKTLVTVGCFVLTIFPQLSTAQEKDDSLAKRLEDDLAKTEREFGPERCKQLNSETEFAVRTQCLEYRTASDRSSFFMHLEGCRKDFPADPDLWEYCIRKAEIDYRLLAYCTAKVEQEAGTPTKLVGPLADAWWALMNQCFTDVWAKLLSKQALSGYSQRARAQGK